MKKYFLAIICTICAIQSNILYSSPHQPINILSWWGYLNHSDIIKEAENQCHVTISYDEYYSNEEFLRRWEGQKDFYDIIIFSDTIYKVMENKIPKFPQSTLWKQASQYHPIIKKHYLKSHYPHNVVYFTHALTGFLWNPKNTSLNKTQSVADLFTQTKHKIVVIIDDPLEAMKLIKSALYPHKIMPTSKVLSLTNFKKVIQDADIYITNNYSQIYKKPNFSFSFSWSGAALLDLMQSNEDYQFLIHPKLSYISSDLIAQTSNQQTALCVTKFLSSKKSLAILESKYYYFSSYLLGIKSNNPIYNKIYNNFVHTLPLLNWLDSPIKEDFEALNHAWQLIKISLNHHIER